MPYNIFIKFSRVSNNYKIQLWKKTFITTQLSCFVAAGDTRVQTQNKYWNKGVYRNNSREGRNMRGAQKICFATPPPCSSIEAGKI